MKFILRQSKELSRACWFGSKKKMAHRQKFTVDYEYYSDMNRQQREMELQRIHSLRRSKVQSQRKVISFPIKQPWEHDGVKYMTHYWEPKDNVKPKAVLIFLHSLNGHTSTCGEMAMQLSNRGYVIAGVDFKNFGESQGDKRGQLESFEDMVSMSTQFAVRVKNKYPQLKIFMGGMSLGGAVAFNVSLKCSFFEGLVMVCPSIRQNRLHYPILKKLTTLLSSFMPEVRLLKSDGRNGSKYLLDDYVKKDPLIYRGRVWVKTVQQILWGMAYTSRKYEKLNSPYLLVQAGSDKLVDPFACLDLEDSSPSKDKTTVLIHGMWHAVWFDDHLYDVIKIVNEWLDERV